MAHRAVTSGVWKEKQNKTKPIKENKCKAQFNFMQEKREVKNVKI